MIFVFIIAGAIIAGTFLQSVEFSVIGGFLGFLLNKLLELDRTVLQLRKSVKELTYQLKQSLDKTPEEKSLKENTQSKEEVHSKKHSLNLSSQKSPNEVKQTIINNPLHKNNFVENNEPEKIAQKTTTSFINEGHKAHKKNLVKKE